MPTDESLENYVGSLTGPQTVTMLGLCMDNLTVPEVVRVIASHYDDDDLEEILGQLENKL